MPNFFGTVFLQFQQAGVSEVYPLIAANYSSANAALGNIITARRNLLASDTSVIAARLSDAAIPGDSYATGLAFPLPGTYVGETGPVTYRVLNVALRVRVTPGPLRRGTRWLHFLPNTQFAGSGVFTPSLPFDGFFVALKTTALANNLALVTRTPGVTPPQFTFTPALTFDMNGISTRKVGRPFGQPRGRVTTR